MAITTLDGVIAGMQPPEEFAKVGAGTQVIGRYYSPFYVGSRPGAAVAPSPGVNGAALTTYAGQIPFTNGASDQYLARFSAWSATIGTLVLCDRLWHNSGLSVTSLVAQPITFPGLPSRDSNAAGLGHGVRIGLEVSTLTGAGLNVPQITYTDQDGNTGITANSRFAYSAASVVGSFYDFALAAGDTGVRAVTSYINTVSMTSGAIHLVAYRELARVAIPLAATEYYIDALTAGMPKLHDNTVPFFLWLPGVTTAPSALMGQVIFTHG